MPADTFSIWRMRTGAWSPPRVLRDGKACGERPQPGTRVSLPLVRALPGRRRDRCAAEDNAIVAGEPAIDELSVHRAGVNQACGGLDRFPFFRVVLVLTQERISKLGEFQ